MLVVHHGSNISTCSRRISLSARAHWPLCLATGGRVFVADPSTLGRHVAATAKFPYSAKFPTLLSGCHKPHEQSLVCSLRTQPQKRAVCGGDEPQPVAHLSHKLQCARQSLKIMVSYGNKYPRHNARPHVAKQSGQCARALTRLVIIPWCHGKKFLLSCFVNNF